MEANFRPIAKARSFSNMSNLNGRGRTRYRVSYSARGVDRGSPLYPRANFSLSYGHSSAHRIL